MDVAAPISKLKKTISNYYMNIRDVYDSKKYQQFVSNLGEADKHRYDTLIFNTDGAPTFKISTYSIWTILLMLNEVLWFRKDKPNMNVFLELFVEQ